MPLIYISITIYVNMFICYNFIMEEINFSDNSNSSNDKNETISQIVQSLLEKKIDEKKDILNEIPTLHFVEDNLPFYKQNIEKRKNAYTLLSQQEKEWIDNRIVLIKDSSYEKRLPWTNTLTLEETKDVLRTLPLSLLNVSNLENLNYSDQNNVILPWQFDNEWDWVPGSIRNVPFVSSEEEIEKDFQTDKKYPLMKEYYKRGLMLIGRTSWDWTIVYQTSVSPHVSTNKEAIEAYQKHVLVHEFFHTIFAKFRNISNANNLIIKFKDGTTSTFGAWRNAFLLSMKEEPLYTTKYASVYDKDMIDIHNGKKGQDDYWLEEQLCESLTAYYFDIAPNEYWWTSFEKFNFWNKEKKEWSERYKLVHDFFNADFEVVG